MEFTTYLKAIRKHWLIVVLLMVLGLGGAALDLARTAPTYASSVTFFVSTPDADSAGGAAAFQADEYAQRRVDSYIQIAKSQILAQQVVASGVELSTGQVAQRITASSSLNTVLLSVQVRDTNADRSLKIATAVSKAFPKIVSQLDGSTSNATSVQLHVTSGPSLNPSPVAPRKTLEMASGLLAGLVLGIIAAVWRSLADTSLRDEEELREVSGEAVLSAVSFDRQARGSAFVLPGAADHSLRHEAFRQLRTNLRFFSATNPLHSIVVTSSQAGEGKTTTSVSLATVFAESGMNVLLVEADLRRPRISDYLGISRAVGLSNVLAGEVELDDVVQRWGQTGVHVLPSGTLPPNPAELLGSPRMKALLGAQTDSYDAVVIDTPPLLPVTDAAVVSAMADGVVLVVRHGKTSRKHVQTAVRALRAVDARLMGTVFNMVPLGRGARRGYAAYSTLAEVPLAEPPAVPTEPIAVEHESDHHAPSFQRENA